MEGRIRDLEDIKKVLEVNGVMCIIVYGALLGHYRDGNFLPGDDDIDIAVIDDVDHETRKKVGWMLYDLGFKSQSIMFNVFGRMEPIEEGYNGAEDTGIIVCERNFKFTIFFFRREHCNDHHFEYVCYPKLGAPPLISIPAKFFDNGLGQIKIGKQKYPTPSPIKDYLAWSYYDNWKDKTDRRHSPLHNEIHKK